jgi:hypothetical protein
MRPLCFCGCFDVKHRIVSGGRRGKCRKCIEPRCDGFRLFPSRTAALERVAKAARRVHAQHPDGLDAGGIPRAELIEAARELGAALAALDGGPPATPPASGER